MRKKREFEVTLKVKVECLSLEQANTIANGIVEDLKRCGEYYIDRPINDVRWSAICPVFDQTLPTEIEVANAVDDAVAAVNLAMDQSDAIDYRDQPNDVDL